jgi:hypothetical protein
MAASKRRRRVLDDEQKPLLFNALVAPENVLADRTVHAPIGVNHLGDAEIGTD